MKITTNNYEMLDIVRFGKRNCQVVDIIGRKGAREWLYDIIDEESGEKFKDIPESKIRELTPIQVVRWNMKHPESFGYRRDYDLL